MSCAASTVVHCPPAFEICSKKPLRTNLKYSRPLFSSRSWPRWIRVKAILGSRSKTIVASGNKPPVAHLPTDQRASTSRPPATPWYTTFANRNRSQMTVAPSASAGRSCSATSCARAAMYSSISEVLANGISSRCSRISRTASPSLVEPGSRKQTTRSPMDSKCSRSKSI